MVHPIFVANRKNRQPRRTIFISNPGVVHPGSFSFIRGVIPNARAFTSGRRDIR
jgi:hypothetical protein